MTSKDYSGSPMKYARGYLDMKAESRSAFMA
jgi:hypothetical protein